MVAVMPEKGRGASRGDRVPLNSEPGEVCGSVASLIAAVEALEAARAQLVEEVRGVEDQDLLLVGDIAGQLSRSLDSLRVTTVREMACRSEGDDRSAWLCRRAGFASVQAWAQHAMHLGAPGAGLLNRVAAATTERAPAEGAEGESRDGDTGASFPALRTALDDGEVSLEQARPIVDRLGPLSGTADPAALSQAERDLVSAATGGRVGSSPGTGDEGAARGSRLRPAAVDQVAKQAADGLEPEGLEARYATIVAARGLRRMGATRHQGARITIDATPELDALLDTLMKAFLDPRNGDTCAAPFDVTAEPGNGDERSWAQKQHDALFQILSAATTDAPVSRGAKPHLLVVARAEQLVRALSDSGAAVDAGVTSAVARLSEAARSGRLSDDVVASLNRLIAALEAEADKAAAHVNASGGTGTAGLGAGVASDPRLLHGAWLPATDEIIPFSALAGLICDGVQQNLQTAKGHPLSFTSDEQRLFTAAQRRALVTMYPTCAVPGCTVPGMTCDAHHVQWVSQDGPTTVANGILLCPFHHHQLHLGHYRIRPRQEGLLGAEAAPTSSAGRGPTRTSMTDRRQRPASDPPPTPLGPPKGAPNTGFDKVGDDLRRPEASWVKDADDPATMPAWAGGTGVADTSPGVAGATMDVNDATDRAAMEALQPAVAAVAAAADDADRTAADADRAAADAAEANAPDEPDVVEEAPAGEQHQHGGSQ